ncbi:hypothetical protein TWF506_007927 [Arthrobotrys conoides]|uniref:Mitochondrial carrier protein n=1 Tax=Arthrobotrys conoides TaxID=74498 RepID=A0AAN8NPZ9_9PEZI
MSHTDVVLAGATAAFAIDLIVYPLDTIKTRIQASSEWTAGRRALFKGAYQGVGSIILATLPSSAAFFLTYNFLVKNLSYTLLSSDNRRSQGLQSAIHALSSAVAETASCAILTPAEVIKQNAQVVSPTSRNGTSLSLTVFKRLLKEPKSLFRGYTALVSRNLPFTALQFPLYEEIRRRAYEYKKIAHPSLIQVGVITAISAGSAGSFAAAITTPLDVIKTRMMLLKDDGRRGAPGIFETARMIVRTEGPRAIWKGGLLRVLWTFLGSGLYLGTFESSKIYLSRRREIREQLEARH